VRLANITALVLMLIAGIVSASAQHRGSAPMPQRAPRPATQQQNSFNQGGQGYSFHPKGPGPHRGDWLRKYMTLPPQQQEHQLQNDPAFRSLPSQRQNQLMQRLRTFNSQPPQKKAQILDRMETFEHMTPQQQQTARNLFGQYHNLPEDQRTKVSQAYRRLRGMPPSARNELLNSDEFRNNFSPEQRDLLRGMTDLNVNPSR